MPYVPYFILCCCLRAEESSASLSPPSMRGRDSYHDLEEGRKWRLQILQKHDRTMTHQSSQPFSGIFTEYLRDHPTDRQAIAAGHD